MKPLTCNRCGRELDHERQLNEITVEPCDCQEDKLRNQVRQEILDNPQNELYDKIATKAYRDAAQQVELEEVFDQVFSIMEAAGREAVENQIDRRTDDR